MLQAALYRVIAVTSLALPLRAVPQLADTASTRPTRTQRGPPCPTWPNHYRHFRDQQPLTRRPEGAARALQMCSVLQSDANTALLSFARIEKDDPGPL